MKKVVYAGLALLFLGSVGCTKSSPVRNQLNNEQSNIRGIAAEDFGSNYLISTPPANPNNPYDFIGSEHDRIIMASESVWQQDSVTRQEIYDGVVAASGYNSDSVPSFGAFDTAISQTMADTSLSFSEFISQDNDLSQLGKNYANELYSKFENLPDDTSYDQYVASFVSIESQIQNDGELSESEGADLLSLASVIRYSSVLWINEAYAQDVADGTASPLISNGGDNGQGKKPGLWKKIVHFFSKHKKQILGGAVADMKESQKAPHGFWGVILVIGASVLGYLLTKP